jgi:hypothetical protein
LELNANISRALAKIFGELSIAEIEGLQSNRLLEEFRGITNFRGAEDLASLEKIPDYPFCYAKIKEVKKVLESVRAELGTSDKQVKTCLRLVEQEQAAGNIMLLEQIHFPLIEGWFIASGFWDTEAQQTYNVGREYITEWRDFFLSYTNRGVPQINKDYSELIYNVLKTNFIAENEEKKNCVANVIYKYLRREGLEGFFSEEAIECGEEIAAKVYQYCKKTFAMIQFIESFSFESGVDHPSRINWCWEEFHEFCKTRNALTKTLGQPIDNYFVITPPVDDTSKLIPTRYLSTFEPWIMEVKTRKADRLKNQKLFAWEISEVFGSIAKSIKKERDRFITHLLKE